MKHLLWLAATLVLAVPWGGSASAQDMSFSKPVTIYLYRADDDVPVSKAVAVYVRGTPDEAVPVSKPITVEVVSVVYGDPWSKAITVCVPPYTFQDAASALRLAAGLGSALPATRDRYNVVALPPSGRVVDVLDAVYIAVLAANAPPPCN